MRIIEKLLVLLLLLLLNASGPAQAMERVEAHPSIRKVLRLDPRPSTFRLPAPVFFPERAKAPTATIQVNYTNFTEAQRQAFQAAADIWGQTVSSTVPIVIDAKWAQLDPGVLGQSGPTSFWRNFANSEPNRWYAVSLANKLAGTDLDPDQADMEITFNTDYAAEFYYGVDGNPPADKVDFFTTILHEICHGLNFLGSFSTYNGMGRWGYGTGTPFIFDPLYYNGSNQQLINTALFANPSSALLGQMTSNNVFCKGIKTMQANGGNPVKIYAPATWKPGSSMSHWDEIYRDTPNALMCYALSRGASIHDPGPFTRGLLEDIGWTLVSPSVPAIGFAPATLSPSCQPGQNAASQTFEVWNSGGDALNYSISDNQTWLSCTPAGGTSTGERDTITVNYATSGLAAGTYNATITITASGASNTPQTIPVSLTVTASGPVQWSGNNHWYEAVIVQGNISWTAAKAAAEARGGYLATITSGAENAFVFSLINDWKFWSGAAGNYSDGPWLGGYYTGSSGMNSNNWAWVTGESWGYANWYPGQPDSSSEKVLNFWAPGANNMQPTWNNINSNRTDIKGYVVEWNSLSRAKMPFLPLLLDR